MEHDNRSISFWLKEVDIYEVQMDFNYGLGSKFFIFSSYFLSGNGFKVFA